MQMSFIYWFCCLDAHFYMHIKSDKIGYSSNVKNDFVFANIVQELAYITIEGMFNRFWHWQWAWKWGSKKGHKWNYLHALGEGWKLQSDSSGANKWGIERGEDKEKKKVRVISRAGERGKEYE